MVVFAGKSSGSFGLFLRNKFDIIGKEVGKYKPEIVEFILQYRRR